jgi:TRAP-type mannitol/chloroaromatic compound transport system permease small subunit
VSKIADTAARAIARVMLISTHVNAALAALSCLSFFLLMLYMVSDVTGRYLFSHPMPGTLDIGASVLVFGIYLSLAYVLICGEHVRLTVVVERFPPQWQAWLEILAFAFGCGLMLIIAWLALPEAIYSYETLEWSSTSGGFLGFTVRAYPAKFALFVGSTLFCIQFFLEFVSRIFARLAREIPAGREES